MDVTISACVEGCLLDVVGRVHIYLVTLVSWVGSERLEIVWVCF